MDGMEVRRHVRALHELAGSGEHDPERRTGADADFRDHYRSLRAEWEGVPGDAAHAVEQAFLALVGDDDWTRARECLELALDRLG